nr:MAG TPA: Cytochrome oxidase c subunit VIII [Herelleviridae sp.]
MYYFLTAFHKISLCFLFFTALLKVPYIALCHINSSKAQ